MNASALNHQFRPTIPAGQHGYFQQSQSRVPFITPSQTQIPSAFGQANPERQEWVPQDRIASSMLPGVLGGVPQWLQPPFLAHQQHQQLWQLIGDRQPLQPPPIIPEYLPQRPVQNYHPQPSVHASVPPGSLSHHSVQDLVATVAVRLGYIRNGESAPAITQCANNDKIVIDALRQGKAKGLGDLVAIEKLGNASEYANGLWKNYYIARLPQIYPKVHPTGSARRGVARSRVSSSQTRSRMGLLSGRRKQNYTGTDSHANPIAFMDRRLGHDFQAYQPSSPISEHQELPMNVQVRSRRGGPIPEYHAGTLIPPLDPSLHPKPPPRDSENVNESHKFSDEDKIFFIHFLKWYLRQGIVAHIPDREELYLLLARQTPHHNAEAWKRHWDDAPELPDKIYIEARKRADDEAIAGNPSLSPSSNEGGSEDGIEAADDEPLSESTSQVLNQAQRAPRSPCPPKKTRRPERVTEEDLREMAQYKYERRGVWEGISSRTARWKEFAQRSRNQKRSLIGWYSAFRGYSQEIDRYYNEYATSAAVASDERSEMDAESELEYLDRDVTTPQHDCGSTSGSTSTSSGLDSQTIDKVVALTVPQKRNRIDSEDIACSLASAEEVFPAAKRMKEEEDEKPKLVDYNSD